MLYPLSYKGLRPMRVSVNSFGISGVSLAGALRTPEDTQDPCQDLGLFGVGHRHRVLDAINPAPVPLVQFCPDLVVGSQRRHRVQHLIRNQSG